MVNCAKTLFGRYLLRNDGALLYETDPTSTAQTPVLDASTGLTLSNVISVEEAYGYGCAVLGDTHTVSCWRTAADGNSVGQLGSGTTDTSGPLWRATQVLTGPSQPLTDVVSLSTQTAVSGGSTACAITAAGKLYCWGDLTWTVNGGTRMMSAYGLAITSDGVTPFTGVLHAALDYSFACAVVQGPSSKEVWCWGNNAHGQLGTGDTMARRTPTKVVGIANPTKVVTFGSDEYGAATCVLDSTNVRCWGSNDTGQLGLGTTTSPILAPTLVTLMGGTTALSNIVDIQGGIQDNIRSNACVQTGDNTLLCWGQQFTTYPTAYGVGNVAALGNVEGGSVRYLTTDGNYHVNTTTRMPNCGLLQ